MTLDPSDSNIYWTDGPMGAVFRCATSGCASATQVGSGVYPTGVAVSSTTVYWTNSVSPSGTIAECPAGGCAGAPSTIASGQQNPSIAATDGVNVYWGADVGILACPVGGCGGAPTTLSTVAPGINATQLLVEGGSLYGSTGGSVVGCATGGCGGTPVTLESYSATQQFALDSANVYWTDGQAVTGHVYMCPR